MSSPTGAQAGGARVAVEVVGAVKTYGVKDASVRALGDVSLTVPSGSWTAVMGPSGSGKSTLLHCMAGLERLDGGRIALAGTDITAASEKALTALRRDRIGFVFQNFNLIASLTAEQNVALPLKLAGRRPPRDDVRAALESVGLGERAAHRPGQLSGGQQQRVAIARALVTRPEILFADEPTGALDTASARHVLRLLGAITAVGRTIVMVTHDPVTASHADTVVFLRDGTVVGRLLRPSAAEVAERLAGLEG